MCLAFGNITHISAVCKRIRQWCNAEKKRIEAKEPETFSESGNNQRNAERFPLFEHAHVALEKNIIIKSKKTK